MFDQTQVSKEVFNILFDSDWEDEGRKAKALKDIEWTLIFIMQSVELENDKILYNYYLWLKRIFRLHQLDLKFLDKMFKVFQTHLKSHYNFNIDDLIDALPHEDNYKPIILSHNKLEKEMKKYMNLVLDAKRNDAKDYILSLIENKINISDIYLYVFQESLREVGELWMKGEVSIAMEHYFTASTQYIMSTLYDTIFTGEIHSKKVLACAVGSELHEIGIRMVADLFQLNGWDSRYLGASVPINEIVDYAVDFKPQVIALGITMGYHISDLQRVVRLLKSEAILKNTKIIVGGLPFINNEELFKSIGADAYSINALDGIRVANEII